MEETKIPFRKVFWSVFLSRILSFFGLLVFIGIIIGLGGLFDSDESAMKSDTILHVKLNGLIAEENSAEVDPLALSVNSTKGLSALLHGLKAAAKDDNVKGLFLDFGTLSCGISSAQELREGIDAFKESKKFVVAYHSGEYISQQAYYVASAADEIYGFPGSMFQWNGLGGEVLFIKELLAKMGLEVSILKGNNNDFKSAVEPLFLNKMSDSSRLQMQVYMQSTWNTMLTDIVSSRGLKHEDLNTYANNLEIKNVNDAVEKGMIDESMYRDEVLKILMKKVKVKEENELNFYSFSSYSEEEFLTDQILARASEPKVAVILAEGSIAKTGKGFSSDNICALFKKARKNESVKSVVFRVNSPGGSALASEEIWREVSLTNEVKKVIVSMGDYAASGGYYVSSPAHKIFADQTTLTGSIGVFGVLPYTKEMLGKIGVEVDEIGTHDHAVASTNHKLSDFEFEIAQQEVNKIYQQFLLRVANGRGMSKEKVDAIARGRVWTGSDAVKIGLVDTIGSLQAAISYAQSISNSNEDGSIVYYPEVEKKPFADLISLLEEEGMNVKAKQNILNHPILESLYENIESAQEWEGMVMRLPFQIDIK
tara:strand:+ start:3780 stop:5567 length:1788 start_codon:yes stop_codon:yes gene_type:complete